MKKTNNKKFGIVSKDTGNILVLWNEYATDINPFGRTYVTYEHFVDMQSMIADNNDLGIPTVFNSKKEATAFMEKYGVKNGEVLEYAPAH
jgi:hypothetical protein